MAVTLEDQIRQRWGQYGNWQHAEQDLVAQLAGLFRANGISDISNLRLTPRQATLPGGQRETESGWEDYGPQQVGVWDAHLGDQELGYLGDVNRDGSYTLGGQEARNHGGMEDIGRMGMDGNLLAWSAGVEGKDGAKGHLNFQIVEGPDGQGVVVPVWESSAAGDIANAKLAAATIAAGVGGYYLGPEAAAGGAAAEGGAPAAAGINWGNVGTGALKGAGSNMALTAVRGGDANAILRSGLTGAVSGGMGGVGAGLDWDPTLTAAGTSAGLTLANGGTAGDALRSGLASGLSTYGNAEGITGNQSVDRAITGAGSAAIRGGDGNAILMGGLNGLASGTQRTGNNYGAGDIDGALSEDNIVRFDEQQEGGNTMDDFGQMNWDVGLDSGADVIDTRSDENGYGDFGTGDGTTLGGTAVDPGDFGAVDDDSNYSHEGDNYKDPNSTQGSGGSPINSSMDDSFKVPDWALNGFNNLAKIVGTGLATQMVSKSLANPVDTGRFNQLFDAMLTEQSRNSVRSEDMWQNYLTTFRPIEQRLAATAAGYDTPERRERAATDAVSAVSSSYDEQRTQAEREMTRMGLDPTTIQVLGASSRLTQAKDEAGAANKARSDVETTGLNLLSGVANLGRGNLSTGLQASSVANASAAGANSAATSDANVQNANTNQRNSIFGDILGAGLQAWGMGLFDAKPAGT